MNNYIFLSFSKNYADEFDTNGFRIVSFKRWDEYRKALRGHEDSFELYFGSNQYLEFNSGQDLLNKVKAVPISNSEKLTFEKTTGLSFGWFPDEVYAAGEGICGL